MPASHDLLPPTKLYHLSLPKQITNWEPSVQIPEEPMGRGRVSNLNHLTWGLETLSEILLSTFTSSQNPFAADF